MIKLKVMEYISIKMVQNILVSGKRISSMVKVQKLGLMVLPIKENIEKEKNMEKEILSGKMDLLLKEILLIMILRVQVNMCGQTREYLQANGKTIKWMDLEYLRGLTVEFMKDNMKTIKNVGMEYFFGLMEENMMVNGQRVSNMELGNIQTQMGKLRKESGNLEKELSGFEKREKKYI